jgi:hypothetical protein
LNSNSDEPLGPSPLLAIQAHGNLHVDQFGLKKVLVTQVATQVNLDRGKVTLTALRAQLLQGTHQGNWTIDLSKHDMSKQDLSKDDTSNHLSTPDASTDDASTANVRYHGAGTLNDIALAQVGTLMNDDWIAGTVDGNFDVEGSGDSFRELRAQSGKLQFVMRKGSLPHIEIPGSPVPLPVHRFTGELHLKKGVWELSGGRLESRDGIYRVSGTDSPGSGLDFVLARGDEQSWTLTGTLAKPHLAPGSRTVAKRTDTNAKNVKP